MQPAMADVGLEAAATSLHEQLLVFVAEVHWYVFVTFARDSELGRDGGAVERDERIASYGTKPRRLNGDNLLADCLATGLLTSPEATNLVVGCPKSDGGVQLGVDLGRRWCVQQVTGLRCHRTDSGVHMRHLGLSQLQRRAACDVQFSGDGGNRKLNVVFWHHQLRLGYCRRALAQSAQRARLGGIPNVCFEIAGDAAAVFELARQVMRPGFDLRANLHDIDFSDSYLILKFLDDAGLSSAVDGD